MKSLSSPIIAQKDAQQSGWCEVYDFYLKSAISTPWGTTSIIRLTTLPGDLAFFAPDTDPEAAGTRGSAQTYKAWPIRREQVRSSSKSANDKLAIVASNVTAEFAGMLALVDWQDVPVVIRKVSTTITSLASTDFAYLFSGLIDSARIDEQSVQFQCSSDMGNLATVAPRENMHNNCRFNWGDDQCTAHRFLAAHYKSKTAGSGGSTTRVKSSDLTEDTSVAGYVAQAVTADSSTDKITLTAHGLTDNDRVKFAASSMPGGLVANVWYWVVNTAANDFKVSLTEQGTAIDITSNGTGVTIDSTSPYGTDLVDALANGSITASSQRAAYSGQAVTVVPPYLVFLYPHGLNENDEVQFGGSVLPGGVSAGVYYWVRNPVPGGFNISATQYGPLITFTSAGSAVTITTRNSYQGYQVKRSNAGYWAFGTSADWGTLVEGYWTLDEITAGTKNPLLKPRVNFDFGSSKTPTLWRFKLPPGLRVEEMVRLISIWSKPYDNQAVTASAATDRITLTAHGLNWGDQVTFGGTPPAPLSANFTYYVRDQTANDFKVSATAGGAAIDLTSAGTSVTMDAFRHESFFELPPRGGEYFECLIPGARAARYWRIGVRTRWAESLYFTMFDNVQAFETKRHWWVGGQIRFDDATSTVALRGVARRVLESYSGEIRCEPLPVAPANGDTFIIERGCNRRFNNCAERLNTENFGGFLELPSQTVIR